jgi:RNA polymerase sigma-70 factor (ECF subfamily)
LLTGQQEGKAQVETDQKLAERCLGGDPEAWETLVRTYHKKIYNLAYRFTRKFQVAEELTQDVFVKIYQNLGSFRQESGSLQSWIMRVGRNLIIDQYRHAHWEKNVAGSEELEVIDFEDQKRPGSYETVFQREKSKFLMDALHSLSGELKQAVLLRDLEEMSYQEIADLLKIPEGTVKSRINRGRIELAKLLSRRGGHFGFTAKGEV